MILEVLRTLTDWLNDPTNGVVAQLALITLEAGDTVPTVGTIADETRNNRVAEQYLPSTPGIAVNLQQIPLLDPHVVTVDADGDANVLIRYGIAAADTKNATRDTSYVLRALARSVRRFNRDTRTRNGIAIYSCIDLRVLSLWQPVEDQIMTGAIAGTWRFRDTAP